jgi:hypothetical protein
MKGSMKVTCRPVRRGAAAAGDGGGTASRRKRRRKAEMARASIILVALNTKRVWRSRAGRASEAGAPRRVCSAGFIKSSSGKR